MKPRVRWWSLLASFALASLFCCPPALAAYETPASRNAYIFEPMLWAYGAAFEEAVTTLNEEGYTVRLFSQENQQPVQNAGDFMAVYLSGDGHGYGAFGILTDGNINGLLVLEAFPYSEQGRLDSQNKRDDYVRRGIFTFTEIGAFGTLPPGPDTPHPMYFIGIQTSGVARYSDPRNAIVHLASCYGAFAAPGWGARCIATYSTSCAVDGGLADARSFWDGLNGEHGAQVRSVADALSGTMTVINNPPEAFPFVVLAPAIQSYSPPDYETIGVDKPAWIAFDSEMNTGISVGSILGYTTPSVFSISNAHWTGNTRIDYTIVPKANGGGSVKVNSVNCYSVNGAQLNPWGNGFLSNAGDPFYIPYNVTLLGSAVSLTSFSATREAGANRIRFTTIWEANTQSFQVQALDPTGEPAYLLPEILPDGAMSQHTYSILDPAGSPTQRYRLIEHQTGGLPDLTYGDYETQAPFTVVAQEPTYYDYQALRDSVDALGNPGIGISEATTELGDYVIVCPDSFVAALGTYANIWNLRGHSVSIVPLSVTASQGGISGYIHWASSHGCRTVLLVGDANDAAWWDNPSKWVNGWNWPRLSPSGPHIPSQPERNLIPTFQVADADSPRLTMAGTTPYFASDLPYADVDSDGLPDLVLGRLPASSVQDIYAYTSKLMFYLAGAPSWQNAYLFAHAQNHGIVPGTIIAADADTIAAQFPPGVNLTRRTDTNWTYAHRESLANTAASSMTDIIAWVSSGSHRYSYSNFWRLDQGWSMAKLSTPPTGRFFVSLGFSCDISNFDQTEEYANVDTLAQTFSNPIRAIGERLLFDPLKGAIVNVGPTRGSYELGVVAFAREFLHHLYTGSKNIGTAFLMAQRTAMVNRPELAKMYRSYVLLGDPLIGPYSVTAVEGEASFRRIAMDQPRPNPFNPSTAVTVHLSSPTTIRVGVYDVHGRLLRELVGGKMYPAGSNKIVWDGTTSVGLPASSGIYFLRLEAAEHRIVRKVVLLK